MPFPSDYGLQPNQQVKIIGARGTRENAFVKGIARNGKVVVEYEDYEMDIVDREDIET